MAKNKILVNNSIICSLSQIDSDNLKLLKANLPNNKSKDQFTDLDKQAIKKYNEFLSAMILKNKGKMILIDSCEQEIEIKE